MATSSPPPIKVRPLLDVKPWGGRRLATCGIALPADEAVGEALLTAPEAVVASGPLAGATLGELAQSAPEYWTGKRGWEATGGRAIFPLLVKLIDAQADLSIQVHPDDVAAAASGLATGKTEAWHILSARPGSVLYLGMAVDADACDFRQACLQADGSAARYLRQVPAEEGLTVIVPAGTPHAIGTGVLLYEIQQPCNVTYRLDDWGRRDARGASRPMHHAAGFAVLDSASRPPEVTRIVLQDRDPRVELLVATRYFALQRLSLACSERVALAPVDSPQVLTCLEGAVNLATFTSQEPVTKGETIVVPADLPSILRATQASTVLRGWVPDLEREIIDPAIAAGASRDTVAQLGIEIGAR